MFTKSHMFASLLFAAFAVAPNPASSLTQDEVVQKLDSIIVFSPIDASSSSPSPQPVRFRFEGKVRDVYFATFSPSAVRQVIDERLKPNKVKNASELKFAPFSLSKFDSIVNPLLSSSKDSRVIYVPDPKQAGHAERLLIKQGASEKDASKVAASIPSVFCPSPSITLKPNSGPLKNKAFIPCSMNFELVNSTVERAISENPKMKKTLSVVAIPITNFASMLSKGSSKDVGEFRVLPSPENVNVINQLRDTGN